MKEEIDNCSWIVGSSLSLNPPVAIIMRSPKTLALRNIMTAFVAGNFFFGRNRYLSSECFTEDLLCDTCYASVYALSRKVYRRLREAVLVRRGSFMNHCLSW